MAFLDYWKYVVLNGRKIVSGIQLGRMYGFCSGSIDHVHSQHAAAST